MIDQADSESTLSIAMRIGERMTARGWLLTTAESCTGGWVAKIITDAAGSSVWFDQGFVTYSNTAKQEMLGVRADTLMQHGAVSERVVKEMVAGALERSQAQVAVAISGIAGPGGGTPEKPVGTVWFGWGLPNQPILTRCAHVDGDREAVRHQAVCIALAGLLDHL